LILHIDLAMKIRNIIFFITALFFTGSVFALPALAPVFASIGTAVVASLGITATVATGTLIAIGVATVVVGAYAGSQLLGAMSMDFPDNMSAQARSALANQQGSTNPLPVIYGKRRVGGTPIFYHVSGADNEFLHVVYAIAEGEIQGVSQVYLNNDEVNTTPDLYDTSLTSIVVGEGETAGVFGGITSFGTENIHKPKYEGIVKYEIYNGTTTQTADQDLISETNGTWTSSDRLQGVAYAIVRFKFEPEVFGNTGIPQVNFDVIGKKTRSTTSGGTTYKVFSDNPADCIEDYLTNLWKINTNLTNRFNIIYYCKKYL
jgi:hypothetical protein